MYTGMKLIDPSADVGIDLSREFEQAMKMQGGQT
jgi:hypothetical protein